MPERPFRSRGGVRVRRTGRRTIEEPIDELWRRYAASRGSLELRNRLAERYAPMVRRLADEAAGEIRRFLDARLRERIAADELESAGIPALLDAVSNFDPAGGERFEDYAAPLIRDAIDDEVRSLDWLPLSFFARGIRRQNGPAEREEPRT